MKIGILTFHSQLNYGGVLQCWALQNVLEKMGHEVVVIDRWLHDDNHLLERGFNKFGLRQWLKFAVRSLFGLGDFQIWLRVVRTKRFIRRHLHLTPYHFVEWKDAPGDLGIDCIVVGSDQVWHCGDFGDPRVYLLENGPFVPAIAYAASFGMVNLPQCLSSKDGEVACIPAEPVYRRGLENFQAVSCREKEGVALCRQLGFDSANVVDPTLLAFGDAGREEGTQSGKKDLVCYFLSERLDGHFDALENFACRHQCRVKVFLNAGCFLPLPTNIEKGKKWSRGIFQRCFSHVRVMDSAGPEEFFEAFRKARWVISDSFHALMFSITNGCNARILKPSSEFRQQMFGRIKEFADHAHGNLVVDSVKSALDLFEKGEIVDFDRDWLEQRRQASMNWLLDSLKCREGSKRRDCI